MGPSTQKRFPRALNDVRDAAESQANRDALIWVLWNELWDRHDHDVAEAEDWGDDPPTLTVREAAEQVAKTSGYSSRTVFRVLAKFKESPSPSAEQPQ